MPGVVDAAVHVHATSGAGMALNGGVRIDDAELLSENTAPAGFQHLVQPQA